MGMADRYYQPVDGPEVMVGRVTRTSDGVYRVEGEVIFGRYSFDWEMTLLVDADGEREIEDIGVSSNADFDSVEELLQEEMQYISLPE